jgi:hypothetical protein
MTETMIGARIGPMDVSRAARQAQMLGTDSRATVVRYALRRVAGATHEDAMRDAKPDAQVGMVAKQVTATMPAEWIDEARAAVPEATNDATLVRYSLYILDGYTHEEALDEATRTHKGRVKGSKNKPKV